MTSTIQAKSLNLHQMNMNRIELLSLLRTLTMSTKTWELIIYTAWTRQCPTWTTLWWRTRRIIWCEKATERRILHSCIKVSCLACKNNNRINSPKNLNSKKTKTEDPYLLKIWISTCGVPEHFKTKSSLGNMPSIWTCKINWRKELSA